MASLRDRVICIIGASSGIGRATAVACARQGMRVAVAARRTDRLESLVDELRQHEVDAIAIACDVGTESDPRRTIEQCSDHFGRVDAVLANAGYGYDGSIVDMSDEHLRRIFEVNFFGTVRIARAAVDAFRAQRGGHLLITSSCLSRFTLPYSAAYSATKAAQTHLARALRLELEHEQIDVSVVHPITTRTEFFDTACDAAGVARRGLPKHSPKWFIQPPERVANAIVKCLRKPTPEVWTSHITRLAAGVMVAFPGFHDFCCRRELAHRESHRPASQAGASTDAPREHPAV